MESSPSNEAYMKDLEDFRDSYGKNYENLHGGETLVIPQDINGNRNTTIARKKKLTESELKAQIKELTGKLYKNSPSMFKGWQERYFTLKDKKIKWFKNEESIIPLGVLNFDFYKCECDPAKDDPLCFDLKLYGTDRSFKMKA